MRLNHLLAAMALTSLIAPAPLRAQGGTCGAHAVEIGTSESNGQVIHHCRCDPGYGMSGGVCVPNQSAAAAPTAVPARLASMTVTGTVTLVGPDGQKTTATSRNKFTLPAGTRIVTGPGSNVLLVFSNASRVRVGADSVFAVEVPPGPVPFSMRLAKGVMDLVESGLKRGRIYTPTAVAAVRGTKVRISSGPAGSQITLDAGIVDVYDRNGKLLVTLAPHQTVDVTAGGLAGAPRAAP